MAMKTKKHITKDGLPMDNTQKLVNGDEIVDKIRTKLGVLPTKQFEARNSFLTDLFENAHIRTIYHICVAMLFGLFLNTIAYDYLYEGEFRLGLNLIFKGFTKFHLIITIWSGMFLTSLSVYFGFKLWATIRAQLKPKSGQLKLWDLCWLGLFISFYPSFISVVTVAVISNEIPIAGSLAILCELTRFLMKSHAFVRSNAPRVLRYKPHADDQILCPDLYKFLYFLFAPTLIYQDSYPRTNRIRWNYVATCLIEFIGAIFFFSFILERFIILSYKDYGLKRYTWQDIVVLTLGNVMPSMFILVNSFYTVLHIWQNMFAEMLQFADRMFYKDWWISATHERYHRTWNVIVHDWLYTYIYKDFYEYVLPKNKHAAKYMVFFVSAVFHDFILGVSFRFWVPVLFVQFFVLGVPLTYIKIKSDSFGNIAFWYTTALGMSFNTVGYSLEYYCRVNNPIENASLLSYFVPHLFSCSR